MTLPNDLTRRGAGALFQTLAAPCSLFYLTLEFFSESAKLRILSVTSAFILLRILLVLCSNALLRTFHAARSWSTIFY